MYEKKHHTQQIESETGFVPICVCVAERGLEASLKAIPLKGLAEIRLDAAGLNNTQITQLFAQSPVPLIATFRAGSASDTLRFSALKTAIIAGAAYVDIEIDAPYISDLIAVAKENECGIILSYHHFDCTPTKKELEDIAKKMRALQPDYLKIVTFANSPADALRMLSLYEAEKNLLAFCMGTHGKFSRIASCFLGAPFIYAAPDSGPATADGQMTVSQIQEALSILH